MSKVYSGIGILGGMGPEAGCLLHKHLIDITKLLMEPTRDQEHVQIFHLAWPALMSDRTEFLMNQEPINPAMGAFQVLELFELIAKHNKQQLILGIPCHTFHAEPILTKLKQLMSEHQVENVDWVNMIDATKHCLETHHQSIKKIGVLSTTGTRTARIYHQGLSGLDVELIEVDDKSQAKVHEATYHPQWGIKSAHHDVKKTRGIMLDMIKALKKQGAECVILGCTEIPLVITEPEVHGLLMLDPMMILAQTLMKHALPVKAKSLKV